MNSIKKPSNNFVLPSLLISTWWQIQSLQLYENDYMTTININKLVSIVRTPFFKEGRG